MIPGAKLVESKSSGKKRRPPQHSDPVAATSHVEAGTCRQSSAARGPAANPQTVTWNALLPPLDMAQLLAGLWGLPNSDKTSVAAIRSLQTVQYSQSPVAIHRGLVNTANSCFRNAILQALISIPPLMQLCCSVRTGRFAELCPTMSLLGKWFAEVYSRRSCGSLSGAVCGPRLPPLGSSSKGAGVALAHAKSSFDGMSQQDAHEYLLLLLETCRDELGALERDVSEAADNSSDRSSTCVGVGPGPSPAVTGPADTEKGWITVGKKNQKTVVVSTGRDAVAMAGFDRVWRCLFGGVLATTTKGSKSTARGVASVVREAFISVSVEVETAADPKLRGRHPNISVLLESSLSRKETVQGATGEEREMQRMASLALPLPQILLIHLKRWKITAEGELVKLDNVVHVERQLVIPGSALEDTTVAGRERTYALSAIVAHRGAGSSRGHYVTYIPLPATDNSCSSATAEPKTSAPQFLLCNDSKVAIVDASAMDGDTPYLLFYKKK